MGKTFFDCVTDEGKYPLFGLPATEELKGRSARLPDGPEVRFGEELAVKCDDDMFLAEKEGRLLLIEELPDESLKALDAEKETALAASLPPALEGWENDLSFASGNVLTALFKDGALTLRPTPEPAPGSLFAPGGAPAPKAPEAPAAPLAAFRLQAVETGDKRFLLRFPETGETVFLNARRFLLFAIRQGKIAAGFMEVPAR